MVATSTSTGTESARVHGDVADGFEQARFEFERRVAGHGEVVRDGHVSLVALLLITAFTGMACTDEVRDAGAAARPRHSIGAIREALASELIVTPLRLEPPVDRFGGAVAIDGDTALVGSRLATHVFIRRGDCWQMQQELAAVSSSVALDRDTAVVGSSVFVRTPAGFELQQQLSVPNQPLRVAVSGDTVAISYYSPGYFPSEGPPGAVRVFVRNGTQWQLQQDLETEPPLGTSLPWSDSFGNSLALSGDTLVAGAPTRGQGNNGIAVVFERSGGQWTRLPALYGLGASSIAFFGRSVAVSGDTILVGAPVTSEGGSVFVFVRESGGWTQRQHLTGLTPADQFGISVVLRDGRAAIARGVLLENQYVVDVLLYARSGMSWVQTPEQLPRVLGSFGLDNPMSAPFPLAIGSDAIIVGSDPQLPGLPEAYVVATRRGGDDDAGSPDCGDPRDAGVPPTDAALPDAASPIDSGAAGADAALPIDAGDTPDAAPPDGGDGGGQPQPDAGGAQHPWYKHWGCAAVPGQTRRSSAALAALALLLSYYYRRNHPRPGSLRSGGSKSAAERALARRKH